MTRDQTTSWSPDLTQTIETLRTIKPNLDQQCIVKDIGYKLESNYETTLELDSHANICVLGREALFILDYQQPLSVVGYDESLGRKTYQTVSSVVAYDDPQTKRMLHLIINQAIHIPHLDHHLLYPMQCRVNDVIINNLPKFLAANSTDQTHALTINDPDNPLQLVIFPLTLRGVTLLLNVRTMTIDEFNSQDYQQLHLTSDLGSHDHPGHDGLLRKHCS
jgi:hypothetical protein